jgi:hypothetical protein
VRYDHQAARMKLAQAGEGRVGGYISSYGSGVVERVTDHPHRGVLGMTSVWLGDDSTAQGTAQTPSWRDKLVRQLVRLGMGLPLPSLPSSVAGKRTTIDTFTSDIAY